MSKEEIKLHTIATYNNKQYELQDLLNNLVNSNLKLQQRIDKAIIYIENESGCTDYSGEPYYYLDEDELNELLEILKGKEK